MTKKLRILLLLASALTLTVSLTACGKKGSLEPPGSTEEEKYKRASS